MGKWLTDVDSKEQNEEQKALIGTKNNGCCSVFIVIFR